MTHSDSSTSTLASHEATSIPIPLQERSVAAIVVAAGRGSRFGAGENKVLLPLAGEAIWVRAVQRLRTCRWIGQIVLVVRPCDRVVIEPIAERWNVSLVDGGSERFESVHAGLEWFADREPEHLVAVHDAARPLVSTRDVEAVIQVAGASRAAILATPIRGTIKRGVANQGPISTVDRKDLWEALTPQVFSFSVLRRAFAHHRGRPATDDAELVERSGHPVCLVPGSAENLKITQFEDLLIAEAIYQRQTGDAGDGIDDLSTTKSA